MGEITKLAELKEVFKNIREKPGMLGVLIGVMALGIILILSGNGAEKPGVSSAGTSPEKTAVDRNGIYVAEKRLEAELGKALRNIEGAGRVYVDVNLKSGSRNVWERQARNTKRVQQQAEGLDTEESYNDELVFATGRDGRDSPVLKEELAPEVEGVVVVASGAASPAVKRLLTETVMTVLNLPAHRVMVIEGNKGKDE